MKRDDLLSSSKQSLFGSNSSRGIARSIAPELAFSGNIRHGRFH